jgi:hypothetical protein
MSSRIPLQQEQQLPSILRGQLRLAEPSSDGQVAKAKIQAPLLPDMPVMAYLLGVPSLKACREDYPIRQWK